jgi:hypothetical protein
LYSLFLCIWQLWRSRQRPLTAQPLLGKLKREGGLTTELKRERERERKRKRNRDGERERERERERETTFVAARTESQTDRPTDLINNSARQKKTDWTSVGVSPRYAAEQGCQGDEQ